MITAGRPAASTWVFGSAVFHPNQLHQTYFFEDNSKVTHTLALTLGLRYENFGQYANTLPYPAFSGFDPSQFLVRHEVAADNKDFGPAFGLAWSPSAPSGLFGRLFGDGKTVWRAGTRSAMTALPTQLIALGPATSTPNAITVMMSAPNSGPGSQDWFSSMSSSPPLLPV
jgi:outer membrane receptor protein involved in Fe transport